MTAFEYYTTGMDAHPFTGIRDVDFRAKLSENPRLDRHYDGTPDAEQVTGVTRGKIYEIVQVEGFGDLCDFLLDDDAGNRVSLGSFFFEEVPGKEAART